MHAMTMEFVLVCHLGALEANDAVVGPDILAQPVCHLRSGQTVSYVCESCVQAAQEYNTSEIM